MNPTIAASPGIDRVAGPADREAADIELRLLCAHEGDLVHRIAALDDAPDLDGQVLVAVVGGQGVAALSLSDQRVVANPFIPTSEAVALLRFRAAQLSGERRRALVFRRPRRSGRLVTGGNRGLILT